MNGKAIKNLRAHYDLTQKEMAQSLRVSQQLVFFWESGARKPNINDLATLRRMRALSKHPRTERYVSEALRWSRKKQTIATYENLLRVIWSTRLWRAKC